MVKNGTPIHFNRFPASQQPVPHFGDGASGRRLGALASVIQTSRQKTSICNTNFEASPSRVQEQPDADPPAPPPPLQSRTDDFMDVPIIYATATL